MRVQIHGLAGNNLLPAFQKNSIDLVSAQVYRYSIPFKQPVQIKNGSLSTRQGLLLSVRDSQGNTGVSEASPLPGYSQESLETTLLNVTVLLDKLIGRGEFTPSCLPEMGHTMESSSPSMARYGIETALLALLARQHGILLGDLVFERSSSKVPINGLIAGNISDWIPQAQNAISNGFQTLKFKVGRVNSELEARSLEEVRRVVGPNIKLRLDANRSWNLETAIHFGKVVKSLDIEYIEEPLQNPADLPIFYDACSVPFAFDETLHHMVDPRISFDTYTGLKALVMKPTLISCTSRFLSLVKRAREKGVQTILSSSYESDVGLIRLSQMASAISGEDIAVGLDTRSALAGGTTKIPVAIENGWMSVRSIDEEDLDLSLCEILYER